MKPPLNTTYLVFDATDPLAICQRIFNARYPGATLECIEHDNYHWIGPVPEETQHIPPTDSVETAPTDAPVVSGCYQGVDDEHTNLLTN